MNSEQKKLWQPLDLTKRDADPIEASQKLNRYCTGLLSPEIKKKIKELKALAQQEVERLGGILDKDSFDNLSKNLYDLIVNNAIPEEVLNAKHPLGPV